jgi:hypothetical protein
MTWNDLRDDHPGRVRVDQDAVDQQHRPAVTVTLCQRSLRDRGIEQPTVQPPATPLIAVDQPHSPPEIRQALATLDRHVTHTIDPASLVATG